MNCFISFLFMVLLSLNWGYATTGDSVDNVSNNHYFSRSYRIYKVLWVEPNLAKRILNEFAEKNIDIWNDYFLEKYISYGDSAVATFRHNSYLGDCSVEIYKVVNSAFEDSSAYELIGNDEPDFHILEMLPDTISITIRRSLMERLFRKKIPSE